MNKQACFDAAALVTVAALEVHAQRHGLHQTELQWEDPQRGPSPEAQPKDPADRDRSSRTEPQVPEGEGSEPPHQQAPDRDIPFAERWPLATAAGRERTKAASHAPITSRGTSPRASSSGIGGSRRGECGRD